MDAEGIQRNQTARLGETMESAGIRNDPTELFKTGRLREYRHETSWIFDVGENFFENSGELREVY